jgi:hypothetical protein
MEHNDSFELMLDVCNAESTSRCVNDLPEISSVYPVRDENNSKAQLF